MLVKGIVDQQHRHYLENNSSKSGNRWCIQLITKLWKQIQNHWIHRNSVLYEMKALARLNRVEELKIATLKEYELGLDELPPIYISYFQPPIVFILQKLTAYIRRWFIVIMFGRESCTDDIDIDTCSTDVALRSWVGLRTL